VSVRSTIHNWWPIAAFLSFVLVLQAVFANSIVANGKHASDHLQSAEVIFPIAFCLAVIFWAARAARRHADAWVAGAMVGFAFSVVALGNLRVIWAIGGDRWTDAQAGALGSARPGFDSGHSLVEIGTTAGVAAIIVFIAVLRAHRIVRTGSAIAAAALSPSAPHRAGNRTTGIARTRGAHRRSLHPASPSTEDGGNARLILTNPYPASVPLTTGRRQENDRNR
jgi:hypothetical protein